MIRLFLMLLGTEAVRRHWTAIGVLGLLWSSLGLAVFLDGLDGSLLFPVQWLGYALLFEGVVSLVAGSAGAGAARDLRWAKGVGLLLIGMLTIETSGKGEIVLALLIGLGFAADGVLKVIAARIIRFRGWRLAQAQGGLSLLIAILTLQPWPTWYVGTIGCNIGIALVVSGVAAMIMARRLRRLASPAPSVTLAHSSSQATDPRPALPAAEKDLMVRVWTPGAAADTRGQPGRFPRPLVVDRYIAAVDANGVISTGHAALEYGSGVYISHYPAQDIDRSPENFRTALRATAENDVRGVFKPCYRDEAAEWCEADAQVAFTRFDAPRLERFWAVYREDTTYNLTSRNCSSAVAAALDAALEGVLDASRTTRGARLVLLGRAILSPELWAAALLRKRAETMTWTPGLVLDYARAIGAVVEPPALGWLALARRAHHRLQRPMWPVSGRQSRKTD